MSAPSFVLAGQSDDVLRQPPDPATQLLNARVEVPCQLCAHPITGGAVLVAGGLYCSLECGSVARKAGLPKRIWGSTGSI